MWGTVIRPTSIGLRLIRVNGTRCVLSLARASPWVSGKRDFSLVSCDSGRLRRTASFPSQIHSVNAKRSLFGWLNTVFNNVDKDRIEEVGPDIAAAEWLLRCGGGVKWKNHPSTTRDYNTLPHHGSDVKIEVIDATEACIMSHGFPHLRGLKEVKEVRLVRCQYLDDDAFAYLTDLKSLERLSVISCGNVTDAGLENIKRLKWLKELTLFDLPEIKNRKQALADLRAALPDTRIEFRSADQSTISSKR